MISDTDVIITGGTSGLGAAFAEVYAQKGSNVLVIGRRQQALEQVAQRLNQRYPEANVNFLVLDLSDIDGLNDLCAGIRESSPSLKVLINNAGYNVDGPFHATAATKYEQLLNVHIQATTLLSHAAMPTLINNKGTLINISSIAAFIPTPASPLYGASKMYIKSFTDALAGFYYHQGVKALTVCPGFFRSDFHSKLGLDPNSFYRRRGLFRALKASTVAEQAVKDAENGKTLSISGWNYRLLYWIGRMIPSEVTQLIARRVKTSRPER